MELRDFLRFPEMNNGLPVISREELDLACDDLVRFLLPENYTLHPDRTDLNVLLSPLRKQGWTYMGRYLSATGNLLGACWHLGGSMLLYNGERMPQGVVPVPPHTIQIDRGLYQNRRKYIYRFTLAHEIGHALLHGDFSSSEKNMKEYASGQPGQRPDTEAELNVRDDHHLHTAYDWMEWQANAFASAVLLPKSQVLKVAEMISGDRTGGKTTGSAADELSYANELLITISDVFSVSGSAAFYRMKLLHLIPAEAKRLTNGVIYLP